MGPFTYIIHFTLFTQCMTCEFLMIFPSCVSLFHIGRSPLKQKHFLSTDTLVVTFLRTVVLQQDTLSWN